LERFDGAGDHDDVVRFGGGEEVFRDCEADSCALLAVLPEIGNESSSGGRGRPREAPVTMMVFGAIAVCIISIRRGNWEGKCFARRLKLEKEREEAQVGCGIILRDDVTANLGGVVGSSLGCCTTAIFFGWRLYAV
jgi:hypothetical protein